MRLLRMTGYYLTSSVKQHIVSMLWFLLVLSASSFVLLLFYGEKLRENIVNEVSIRIVSESGDLVITDEICREIDELNTKYNTSASYLFYPSEYVVSDVEMEWLHCSYPETNVYFSETEEQERERILLTDQFADGETVKWGDVSLRVKHAAYQNFARIPYWVLVDTKRPVDYFEVTFWNISLKRLNRYESAFREMFPGATVYNSEVGQEAIERRRMDLLYLLLVLLAVVNISYCYWYCLEKRKKMLRIFFVVGGSKGCRNALMLLELFLDYAVSSLAALCFYRAVYGTLYRYNVVSYANLPEAAACLKALLITGAVILLIFGAIGAMYNRKIERS